MQCLAHNIEKIATKAMRAGWRPAAATKLTNPDTRDAAQFIFFEIAAKFEDFAKFMFQVEVRSSLPVAWVALTLFCHVAHEKANRPHPGLVVVAAHIHRLAE